MEAFGAMEAAPGGGDGGLAGEREQTTTYMLPVNTSWRGADDSGFGGNRSVEADDSYGYNAEYNPDYPAFHGGEGFLFFPPLPGMTDMPGFSQRDMLPEELPLSMRVFFLVTYILIIVLSVAGNSLVIIVVARNAKMRTVTNTFLVSLAVSDMLIAVINMPFQLKFHLQNEWSMGEVLCKFSNYLQGAVIVTSILTLTGIAIDRLVHQLISTLSPPFCELLAIHTLGLTFSFQ